MSENNSDPGSWINRLIGWCFGLLLAVVLLNCTVVLLEQILPALVVILGIVGLVGIAVSLGLLVRWWLANRW